MGTTVTISLVVLVILVIAFILAGLWFRKMASSSADFLLAGRGAPFWLMATAYLGGYVGGASVSGYVGNGYAGGIPQMWASLFVVTGCAIFTVVFARRLNYFGRKTGAVTITDFICSRYGESMRLWGAIASMFRPVILTGMQFLAIAAAMKVVFGTSTEVGVLISSLIILLYLITAGQYSALITQWFQSILQALGIVLFAVVAYRAVGNIGEVTTAFYTVLPEGFTNFFNIDTGNFTTWLLTLCVFYLVDPWMYMWAYVGKTPKVSSNGMLAVLGGSYYNVLPFIAGMVILVGATQGIFAVPEGFSGDALYTWFTVNFSGTLVGVFILVGLLMTIISCGSSFAMNGVTIFTRDIYQKLINKNATDKQVLLASRVSVIVVTVIGIASALWLPILVPLWVLAQAFCISGLFMPVMGAWFWKRSTLAGAKSALIAGCGSALAWAFYAWAASGSPGTLMHGLHACHIGMFVSVPLFIIVSLVTKHSESEDVYATDYKTLGEELKTTDLVPASEKVLKPGVFGWLGAETPLWKFFWVITFAAFIFHYIGSFAFGAPVMGHALVWVSLIVGAILLVIMAVLGGRDLGVMAKANRELQRKKAA